jgi:hypothetical protein
MFLTICVFTAWATHGDYQAARAFVRFVPYFSALFLVVVCVHLVLSFGKDYPVQTTLAVAAITLFGASYVVEGWLALAGFALATVLVITSARAAIRKLFADLRESYRKISATTRQL